jgi:hypothetical protein
MVKAYWPFIRRMKPYADYREYVACGVFNWRALYITALGAQSEYDSADESTGRDYEVPSGNLPETSGWIRQPGGSAVADDPLLGANGEEPIRYLILTKCEPHRRQLGRIVDRINALGTMRLFALKSYSDIADASEHVRMRGQQLDQVMARWIEARKNIEVEFRTDPDNRNSALSALNEYVELQLIEIAAGLDRLGEVVVGGLPYRIARSRYFTRRFHQMRKQLIVGNIESWTSYDQFATRGLQPVFDFIESVGQRLRALRLRLANVMQSIQTSALVSQSEETRKNTRRLELLYASTNSLGIIGVWGVLALWVQHVEKAGKFILGFCARTDLTGLATLMCQVHARTFGETLEVAQEGYVVAGVIVTLLVSVFLALRQMLRWLGIVRFAAVAATVLFVMAMAAWASPMLLPRSWADEITPLVRPLGWMATASAVLFAVGITLEALANLVSRLRRPAEGAIADGI